MKTGSLGKAASIIATGLARFGVLLFFVTLGGGLIGFTLATVAGLVSGEVGLGFDFGFLVGAVFGFCYYAVAHWLVFWIPTERVAKYLIAGTLIGSLPLALIPQYGAVFSLCGGTVGCWLGLTELLIRVWREKRAVQQNEEESRPS